ncbi:MAG: methyl-accepting chemotaxis protein [Bacteroidota bacterium]
MKNLTKTLRGQVILSMGVALLLMLVAFSFFMNQILFAGFVKAEETSTRDHTARVAQVVTLQCEEFLNRFLDWAQWDDSYTFVADGNQGYLDSTLADAAVASMKLDMFAYVQTSGKVTWASSADFKAMKKLPLTDPDLLKLIRPGSPVVKAGNVTRGLVSLPKGIVMLMARPILPSSGVGTPRGTMVAARYLGPEEIEKLCKLTGVSLSLSGSAGSSLAEKGIRVEPLNGETIAGFVHLKDIEGKPAILLKVEMPRKVFKQGQATNQFLLLALFVGGGILVGAMAFLLDKLVLNRLSSFIAVLNQVLKRDLTQRLAVSGDEIGLLSSSFNGFLDAMQEMIGQMCDNANTLSSAALELSSISHQMDHSASSMAERSHSIAVASEEMSATMSGISQIASNSASASGDVLNSVQGMRQQNVRISEEAEDASRAIGEAVQGMSGAVARMHELGKAAASISEVTEMIVEIADQTKLLALNATIESARAGEAGKGFAVVANEVKELAKQTNSATEDIRGKINNMQRSADSALSEITGISKVIDEVGTVMFRIVDILENQVSSTHTIAGDVEHSSGKIHEVAQSVVSCAEVSKAISSDITELDRAAKTISTVSSEVSKSASEFAQMGDRLKSMVNQFKVV